MRVFLSAGETSGDAYAAALVREMRKLGLDGFEGVGGPRLRAEGAEIISDSSEWGAISIVQALGVVPKALGGYYRAKRALGKGRPGLFIPIDFGYANIRLARHAKNRGWKVLYFIPPGSWRRDKQGRDLPLVTDAIVTPFSWSAEILNRMGAKAHWFGHPIKQLLGDSLASSEPGEGLAVLPGSRGHEIEANLPLLAEALREWPERLEFALAPTASKDAVMAKWRELSGRTEDRFTVSDTAGVLHRSRSAVVCSGTATLEAALCRRPFVVIYRITESMRREAALLRIKRPKYVALPNILLDRFAVPELVDTEATADALRKALSEVNKEGLIRQGQLSSFEDLDLLLGASDAISQAAALAYQIIDRR